MKVINATSFNDVPVVRIIDDDASFNRSVVRLLEASGHSVVTYSCVGDLLLTGIGNSPGCLLLDLHLPGPSGLDLQQALIARGQSLPTIFMAGDASVPEVVRALKAGAVDFLIKPIDSESLINAVTKAISIDIKDKKSAKLQDSLLDRYKTLTPRECEIMDLVAEGALNKQISAELGAAERTVKVHRANVMNKLEVKTLAELVQVAIKLKRVGSAKAD